MVKKYVFLLMLLCVGLRVAAMDTEPHKQQITLRHILGEGVVSDERISFDVEMLPFMEHLQSLWDRKQDKNDFNLLVADEYSLDTIQFVLDLLKIFLSESPNKVTQIHAKLNRLDTSDALIEVIECAIFLIISSDLLNILETAFVLHFLKTELIQLRDTRDPRLLYRYPVGINSVAFSPDDVLIAAGGIAQQKEKNFVIKSISESTTTFITGKMPSVCSLDFFSNTQIDVGISNFNNRGVFELDISKEISKKYIPISVEAPFITKRIAGKSYFFGPGKDKDTLSFGSIDSKDFISLKRSGLGHVELLAINPAGRLLASASYQDMRKITNTLVLWNTETAKRTAQNERTRFAYLDSFDLDSQLNNIDAIAFSPNGNWLIAAGEAKSNDEKSMALFDLNYVWKVAVPVLMPNKKLGNPSKIVSIAFSMDSKWIVAAGQDHIAIWDVEKGHLLKKITGVKDRINSVALSHNSRMLLVGCTSKSDTVLLWELFEEQEWNTLEQIKTYSSHVIRFIYELCHDMSQKGVIELDDKKREIFTQLDPNLQKILGEVIPNLALENLSFPQPAIIPTEPEPEGWTWKQRAAIALGVGAAAAVAIIKGPEAISKAYDWYQKWNKMKH